MKQFDFSPVLEDCICGGMHTCDVQDVVIENGALSAIPAILGDITDVLLVYDDNTWDACAKRVTEILESNNFTLSAMHFRQREILVPNEDAINALHKAIKQEVKAIVGIGAGVINDLCKWVSHQLGIPYMIVATAPSMDGFASIGAALIIKGMKVTYNAHVPRWIIADTSVLKNAPIHMLRSGAGDILGKISCLNDWKISHIVNGEMLCPEVYGLVQQQIDICRRDLRLINRRDEQAIERLMRALVTIGFGMSYVGNSRPASGSEHHLSHFFEVTGIINRQPYLSHGVDVIYSTVVTCALRRLLLQRYAGAVYKPLNKTQWDADMRKVYGPLAQSLDALQEKLGVYGDARLQRQISIQKQWPILQSVLADVPSEQTVLGLIEELGLDFSEFSTTYSREGIQNAIIFAKELKDRYTLLWLLQDMGLLEELAESYAATLT